MRENYLKKIYEIGNIIAVNLSNDVPFDIGPGLYSRFCKTLSSHKRCSVAVSLVFAIESELNAFQEIIDDNELESKSLDDFKERLKLFGSYTSWESAHMMVDCAYSLFGTEWEIKSIGSD